MQNLHKKQWTPNISLKEATELCIDFSIKARQKNIIASLPYKLFFCYTLNESPNTDYFHNFSSLFKFSQKDNPQTDSARDMTLRMLSVALKCHFFLYENQKVIHEPYFGVFPDLSQPHKPIFALLYKIENKTIIVCERELKNITLTQAVKVTNNEAEQIKKESINQTVFEFPTIVGIDSFKWFHYKKWFVLKKEIENTYTNTDKQKIINYIKKISTKELLEQKAYIINVPYNLKDDMMKTGCIWNPIVNCWCLPKGYDVELINHYLHQLKQETM